jgi:hypothetical protein
MNELIFAMRDKERKLEIRILSTIQILVYT